MRPGASPGQTGTTEFVLPEMVRGTLDEGSRLALSVPEGLARAIYYAFLVSEVHPFSDGNGRLSRLVMNAELSRVGLNRIIIPTLYHLQYVDCARALTRGNEPTGFIKALAGMAVWCSEFAYDELDGLIAAIRRTHALEESPVRYRLLRANGEAMGSPEPAGS
ncbi:fic family protein [Piscinibacter sakaiensis]|uniref:Fic family protein n=2 Tax=Piscinibacter sakaiensis TaxID=1547922 RepID=A0A0K8P0M8_PISS1|nr:fic family protein [Piscinibacter sakaiensis]